MTPESLVRHELAGLEVAVADSPNPDLVGIAGRVVDETTGTLLVAAGDGVRQVPKADATFRFGLEDCEAQRVSDTSSVERRSAGRSSGRSPREDGDEPREDGDEPREDGDEPREDGDEPRVDVLVDGDRLVARPARRTETNGGSLWQ